MALRSSRLVARSAAWVFTCLVALAACGKDQITAPVTRATYALQSVDAHALPYTEIDSIRIDTTRNLNGSIVKIDTVPLGDARFTRVLQAGSVALKSGNVYAMTLTGTFRQTLTSAVEPVTIIQNGRFVVSGSTYTFTATDYVYNGRAFAADPGEVTVMTESGDTLTGIIDNDRGTTSVYVFTKS